MVLGTFRQPPNVLESVVGVMPQLHFHTAEFLSKRRLAFFLAATGVEPIQIWLDFILERDKNRLKTLDFSPLYITSTVQPVNLFQLSSMDMRSGVLHVQCYHAGSVLSAVYLTRMSQVSAQVVLYITHL